MIVCMIVTNKEEECVQRKNLKITRIGETELNISSNLLCYYPALNQLMLGGSR